MTVSTQTAKVVYQGNGSTTQFAVPFRFIREADLRVVVCSEDGTENELTLTTDYTVSGAGLPSGGSCTLNQAPGADQTLAILRDPDLVQETDYQENDAFPAETHEAALDLLTMIAQTNREHINRAVKLPLSSSLTDVTVPMPEAGRALVWNQGEHGLVNGPAADEIEGAQAAAVQATDAAASAQAAQAAAETARDQAEALAGAGASAITYDNASSGMAAETVQEAIDDLAEEVADGLFDLLDLDRQTELGFFQLAENQAMTDIELVNKRMDTFEDASNINAAGSSGYTHDADNDLARPTPGSSVHEPGLSAAAHTDVKGSITQFIVDTGDTSGHFDVAAGSAVQVGCRMVISGAEHVISGITDDGDATDEVEFEGVLAEGTYTVTAIHGTTYQDSVLKLGSCSEEGADDVSTGGEATANGGTSANAFDDTVGTYWSAGTTGTGTWIGYLLSETMILHEVQYDCYDTAHSPTQVRVDYSTDGGSSWQEGETFDVTQSGTQTLDLSTPLECNAYRIVSTSGLASSTWFVKEVRAYRLLFSAPTGQFYVAALPAVDDSVVADMVSAAAAGDDASQTLVFAMSFDGGSTVQAWDGDSWETVSLTAETGWMDETAIEGIADADWPAPTGDVIVYVGFKTAAAAAIPELSGFTLNVVGRTADMDLVMDPVDTTDGPQSARVFAVLKDVDAITLNTDLKAWVSRNGGSDWDQIALAKVSDFLTDRYTVEGTLESFTHADGGADQAVFRLTSHNHKDFELRFLSQGTGV